MQSLLFKCTIFVILWKRVAKRCSALHQRHSYNQRLRNNTTFRLKTHQKQNSKHTSKTVEHVWMKCNSLLLRAKTDEITNLFPQSEFNQMNQALTYLRIIRLITDLKIYNVWHNNKIVKNPHQNRKFVKVTNCVTNEETFYNSLYAVQQHLGINCGIVKMICEGLNNCKSGI